MYVNYSGISRFCQYNQLPAHPLDAFPFSVEPVFTERLLQNPVLNGLRACYVCVTSYFGTGSDLNVSPARLDFATGGHELTDKLKLEPRDTFESREFYVKAEANIKRNNYCEALKLLEQALKISPENPVYLSTMGLCESMMGDPAKGERMCRMALQLSGRERDPMLFVNLGRVLLERGERMQARENLMKAYKMDNTNAPAALELSRMGVRKKPVIPFLGRDHPLNKYLGNLRHRLKESRTEGLKKSR